MLENGRKNMSRDKERRNMVPLRIFDVKEVTER